MDRDVAEKSCGMVEEIVEKLEAFAAFAHENGAGDSARQAVGVCIAELDMEILEPIYERFPDLMPDVPEEG